MKKRLSAREQKWAYFSGARPEPGVQSIETTLDVIALIVLVSMIVLFVIASRLSRILREIQKPRGERALTRDLEPIAPDPKPPPLPQPLRLTKEDLREADEYARKLGRVD